MFERVLNTPVTNVFLTIKLLYGSLETDRLTLFVLTFIFSKYSERNNAFRKATIFFKVVKQPDCWKQ